MRHPWRTLTFLLLAPGGEAAAQVVRGIVREAGSESPLAGVVVTLHDARGATTGRAALSDALGAYAITAGAPGQYLVSAKRIGVRRFDSPPFTLDANETRSLDITLEALRFELPAVTVSARSPCARTAGESARVASLWEEVRTALTATQISLRDRLFRASITRYARELSPNMMRVVREERATRRGVSESPFRSLPAESLAVHGFVKVEPDQSLVYYAPDAVLLLSDPFVRDHCFSVVAGDAARPGMTGLAFEPHRTNRKPDIRGTVWLDARTFELRMITFGYVNHRLPADDPRIGGEVHFDRLASGAWIVSRWSIRMPQFTRERSAVAMGSRAVLPTDRLAIASFREEGGDVAVETAAGGGRRLATLAGQLVDSTGRGALRGATVSLAGTSFRAAVRIDGSFQLDSLPSGAYTLVAEHPGYEALGLHAGEQELTIEEGSRSVTALQALGTETVLRRLCGSPALGERLGALRVVVRDSASGAPLPAALVRVTFDEVERLGAQAVRVTPVTMPGESDEGGAVMLCEVPAGKTIRVEVRRARDDRPVTATTTLLAGAVSVLELRR